MIPKLILTIFLYVLILDLINSQNNSVITSCLNYGTEDQIAESMIEKNIFVITKHVSKTFALIFIKCNIILKF